MAFEIQAYHRNLTLISSIKSSSPSPSVDVKHPFFRLPLSMVKERLSFGQPNDSKGSASLTVKELPVQAFELDQNFEDVEIEVGWRTWRTYFSSCLHKPVSSLTMTTGLQ